MPRARRLFIHQLHIYGVRHAKSSGVIEELTLKDMAKSGAFGLEMDCRNCLPNIARKELSKVRCCQRSR